MSRSCCASSRVAGILLFVLTSAGIGLAAPATQPATSPSKSPGISISVNGTAQPKVYAGWPMIIQATIADADLSRLTLKLEITDSAGKPVIWPLDAIAPPPADASGLTAAFWILPAAKVSALPAGAYAASAVLLDGKKEAAFSQSLTITLAPAPAPLSPADLDTKFFLRARVALLQKQDAEAQNISTEWIKALPDSLRARVFEGDLHFHAARWAEAHKAYQAAFLLWRKQSPGGDVHPPRELMTRLNASAQHVLDDAAPATGPAANQPKP